MKKFITLKREFISVNMDEKGYFVKGKKSDFNYVKSCAKNEFNITIELVNSDLQPDDSIKHYFKIID